MNNQTRQSKKTKLKLHKANIRDLLETLRREDRSCEICKDIIIELVTYSQKIGEDAAAIRDMSKTRASMIKMKDGFTYSMEDLGARIERNRCLIQRSLEKYDFCCKERKLPDPEKFVCK